MQRVYAGQEVGWRGPNDLPSSRHCLLQKGLQPAPVEIDPAADVAIDCGPRIARLQGFDLAVEVRSLLARGHASVDGVTPSVWGVGRFRFGHGDGVQGGDVEQTMLPLAGTGHAEGLDVTVPGPLAQGLAANPEDSAGLSGADPSSVCIHWGSKSLAFPFPRTRRLTTQQKSTGRTRLTKGQQKNNGYHQEGKRRNRTAKIMTTVSSRSSSAMTDLMTSKAVKEMENVQRNYVARISPQSLPILGFKEKGDCTMNDPRACIHHYDGSPDLACVLYCHISLEFWMAMVLNNMIVNKTMVVQYCLEYRTYTHVRAQNRVRSKDGCRQSVEDMIRTMKSEQGDCRPGVEMLNLDHDFVQPESTHRRKRGTGEGGVKPPVTTPYVMKESRFERRVLIHKEVHDCQRALHSEMKKANLTAMCRPGGRKTDDEGRVAMAIFVIHAFWMNKADKGGYRKKAMGIST
jgi:hypothetical protein